MPSRRPFLPRGPASLIFPVHIVCHFKPCRCLPDRQALRVDDFGMRCFFGGCHRPVIHLGHVPCSTLPSRHCFGAFAAPGACEASALLSHRSGSGSPVPVPPEKQLLVLGAAPTRFRVPETEGQKRRNVCTSTESLSSVSSAAMPRRSSATEPISRSSRWQPRRPGRTTPETGNLAPSGIDACLPGN